MEIKNKVNTAIKCNLLSQFMMTPTNDSVIHKNFTNEEYDFSREKEIKDFSFNDLGEDKIIEDKKSTNCETQ